MSIPQIWTPSGLSYTKHSCKNPGPAPLLFVHGMCGGKWQFAKWLEVCAQNSFEAYALDLSGHGESSDVDNLDSISLGDCIKNLEELILEVIKRPVFLAGHSMGAVITQRFTAQYPALVRHLISSNSATPWGIRCRGAILLRALHPYYLRAFLRNLTFTFRKEDEDLFLNRCPDLVGKGIFALESGRLARQVLCWFFSQTPLWGHDIHCPHLIVSGRYDLVTVPAQQRAMHRKFKGSRLLEIDCGHMPMLETQAAHHMQKILAEL